MENADLLNEMDIEKLNTLFLDESYNMDINEFNFRICVNIGLNVARLAEILEAACENNDISLKTESDVRESYIFSDLHIIGLKDIHFSFNNLEQFTDRLFELDKSYGLAFITGILFLNRKYNTSYKYTIKPYIDKHLQKDPSFFHFLFNQMQSVLEDNDIINKTIDFLRGKEERIIKGGFVIKNGVLRQYTKSSKRVTIPDSVKEIDDYVFKGCEYLEKVRIKDSTKYIKKYAFANCINLKKLQIGKSVTHIGAYAFAGCKNLKEVVIPASVKRIDSSAFAGCSKLSNVAILGSNTIISETAFSGCKYHIIETSSPSDKYVFISYSTKNKDYAEATLGILKDENIGVWMAPYDIPAGSKYAHVINHAIQNCACVLLLLSEQSQASEWVDKEIERAVNYKKTIISMHIDKSQLNDGFSFYLGNQQIVPVKSINREDINVCKIVNAIKSFVL